MTPLAAVLGFTLLTLLYAAALLLRAAQLDHAERTVQRPGRHRTEKPYGSMRGWDMCERHGVAS